MIIDFTDVTKIDSTAAEGIVEGINFIITKKVGLEFDLRNITERHFNMLVVSGLPVEKIVGKNTAEISNF